MWLTNDHPYVEAKVVACAQEAVRELLSWVQLIALGFVFAVVRVPVATMPRDCRSRAIVVSSLAMPTLLGTQLSAAVISVRENNSVTNGPRHAGRWVGAAVRLPVPVRSAPSPG